ncbi:MAG: uracil-DNA glycosylase [candidate division KSB1 bacterium]|nr:uracil-DNA glycosylase [candidate division KSB1 bacterium]
MMTQPLKMEPEPDAEIVLLLNQMKDFFQGERELYGDELYLEYDPNQLKMGAAERQQTRLEQAYDAYRNCQRCGLARQRTRIVFGSGEPGVRLMLIGEAPGYHEDQAGVPFVGNAGQLLDKILQAIQLTRRDVFITNVVKCRPPDNRDPLPEECQTCFPLLKQQLEIIQPQCILLLGRIAAGVLLQTDAAIANLRGRVHEAFGAKVVVTYHPAALLRNPELKRSTWEDVQLFQKLFQ